jgi:DNA polymerase (family X)
VSTVELPIGLHRIADLTEIRGLPREASEWRRLAGIVEAAGIRSEAGLARIAQLPPLSKHPDLQGRADHLARHGAAAALRTAHEALPWLFRRLVELDGDEIGAHTLRLLAERGIVTLGELAQALKGRVLLEELSAREEGLHHAVEALIPASALVPLGRAADILDSFLALVGEAGCGLTRLTVAGDVRRYEPLVEWFAVAASSDDPAAALDAVCALREVQPVLYRRGSSRVILSYRQVDVDLRIGRRDEFGSILHAATGSPGHLASFLAHHRAPRPAASEEEVYRQAGLPWIAPELRHDSGEIEAARSGTLPELVAREHIRGDLHMHTDESDGRDPLVAMVDAAAALGYAYIAITDHSERSFASRTLSIDRLLRQGDDIAALRARFPTMAILHGVEVDIMPDGRLDFPDEVLERLDIVLASLHDCAGHDSARLTRRCLEAIHHPLVNIITHPANRVVGRDIGYELDFDAVFEAAVSTGTALEIDGAPGHLDLDGALARRAVAHGVTLVIDSDCHRAGLLDRQMHFGIGTARRGWVEPRHVLNTRPLGDVRDFFARKRHGLRSPLGTSR